ncbi:ASCH domain-containing protein [Actinomyces urogenitalis]|uniref:ASCH domain-containing protein n=1 Tax=Actinomyces urogenitalis TaxID=103621 RepID=UPI001898214B
MYALTVRQPWASLIMSGHKRVENRPWRPSPQRLPVGQRFYIHSGKSRDTRPSELPGELKTQFATAPTGVLLGTVVLAGIHSPGECDSRCRLYGDQNAKYHWMLAAPEPLTVPVQMPGRLSLWPVKP